MGVKKLNLVIKKQKWTKKFSKRVSQDKNKTPN